MAYQALLFCPDEKTARTVTQVLSELDFAVVPCTEPFGAVKRLMAEHFDAIVVDCDNEQNATLLFKSAHNSTNNQSSLAVAVVEGQAGVAKAFRIGANLVLTKPINVEQAKGTLRVARGLLRKGEAAKPAAASAAAPASTRPAPVRPAPRPAAAPTTSAPRTATPMAPAAPAIPKPWIPAPAPVVASADSAPVVEAEEEVLNEVHEDAPPAVSAAPKSAVRGLDSGVVKSAAKEKIAPAAAAAITASSSGAASAPARARSAEAILPPTLPEPTVDKETEEDIAALRAAGEVSEVAEPSFTFGGNATADSGGGRKKALLGIVALLVVAAAGYAAWTQFQGKSGAPTPVAARPAAQTPAPAPGTTTAPQSAAASATPASGVSTPATTDQQAVTTNSPTSAAEAQPTNSEEEEPAPHSASPAPAKPSHSSGASSKATTPAQQPIVLKNGPAALPAAKPAETTDVPAPSPLAVAAAGGGSLPNLTANEANAPQPVLQTVKVSQGVSQGLLYKKVQPIYPPSALQMRVEGDVDLLATISAHGDITSVKILSGTSVLAHAAADAVKQWKYKPYLLDGKPVEIQTQITVKFKLPQ
jgi:periplasmic protein TonB